jgi:hypothetical protein
VRPEYYEALVGLALLELKRPGVTAEDPASGF